MHVMAQLQPAVSDLNPAPPPVEEVVSVAVSELNSLLLQRVELDADIARIRKLVRRLAKQRSSDRPAGNSSEKSWWTGPFSAPEHRRHPTTNGALGRGRAKSEPSKLERACRIALMEANELVSAEAIYDRILRRGSHDFASYKRPLRAILIVMSGMVKRGEANLVNDAGRRYWRWESAKARLEQPAPFLPA
jgi:hypothetical protein